MPEQYVIDGSFGEGGDSLFCFCPVEGDINGEYELVAGLSYLGQMPPEGAKVVAVIHPDGQEAVERFMEDRAPELEELATRLTA